ncbi:hypothetical protein [Vulcanisaeta souniana]|uniref:Uncharacterized protein n=1 Tax=Vulcanisaeta souniana JCM 11219 TaxID=1293586 RepID=A0A830EDB7_9CREN|nr:hypothetical protein [Vulcanisaeta souniana]BDR91540.1 hypothetical protein Vsou_06330 [Vulcanisaeta souniana JCM 11219]GGI73983.1 hypothetical protein GCM10007112_08510 [Vulcanisaeta souniana JCM 11219]
MSEPRVAGVLMLVTGVFLLMPVLFLGIMSIILVPISSILTTFAWALTLIAIAFAALNLGAGILLLSRPSDSETRTLGIVVAALNLVFTWWTFIGAIFAILELVFLV